MAGTLPGTGNEAVKEKDTSPPPHEGREIRNQIGELHRIIKIVSALEENKAE